MLTNDSLEGQAGPLDELLRGIEQTEADVWGLTLNPLPRRHLHSFWSVPAAVGVIGRADGSANVATDLSASSDESRSSASRQTTTFQKGASIPAFRAAAGPAFSCRMPRTPSS